LLAVECERVETALLDPEVRVESLLELLRFGLEPIREPGIAPDLARESRCAHLRVVDVPLDLASRDRALRNRAVGEADRVPRVLPALVLEARLRVSPFVLDVAVPVAIAPLVDPFERRACVRLEVAYERCVSRPALDLVEQDEEERRRVRRPEVRRVRPLLEPRQLAEPDLVQDLARLRVAERIVLGRLSCSEHA